MVIWSASLTSLILTPCLINRYWKDNQKAQMHYKIQLYALTTNYVGWLLVVMVAADLECVATCHQTQVWAELHVMLSVVSMEMLGSSGPAAAASSHQRRLMTLSADTHYRLEQL